MFRYVYTVHLTYLQVREFANEVEPLLPFISSIQNPGTRKAGCYWMGEIEVVVTNESYEEGIRHCINRCWNDWDSRERFEMLVFLNPQALLAGDIDDGHMPNDATKSAWTDLFPQLENPEIWNELVQYSKCPARALQDEDVFHFWGGKGDKWKGTGVKEEMGYGQRTFPNLAPYVVSWLSAPISVTSVDAAFSTLNSQKNKRGVNANKEKIIEKFHLRKNAGLLNILDATEAVKYFPNMELLEDVDSDDETDTVLEDMDMI